MKLKLLSSIAGLWAITATSTLAQEIMPFAAEESFPEVCLTTTSSTGHVALLLPGNSRGATLILERAPDNDGAPGGWEPIATIRAGSASFEDADAAPGVVYWYRVRPGVIRGNNDP